MFGPSVGMDADREASTAVPSLRGRPLVILPTLNEEAGLAKTLAELVQISSFVEGRLPEMLVVDGHSTDRTLEIARQYPCTILEQRSRGKGAAIREGLGWAREHGFDYVGVLDADATYPSERLPALFRLLDLGADVVIGLRRPDFSSDRTARDLVHRFGNGALNLTAALFSRGPVLDVCSGFWGVRTSILPRLQLDSNGFEIESELFVKSFRLGLHIVQIPVTYRERTGVAKLQAGRDGARILMSILRQSHRAAGLARTSDGAVARPSASPTRDLPALVLALALTLDPTRVQITTSTSRLADAGAIAEQLTLSHIGVEMITDGATRVLPPGPYDSPPTDDGDPRGDRSAPLEVSLLDDPVGAAPEARSAYVAVPRSRHFLRLGVRGVSPRPTPALTSESSSPPPSTRIERAPGVARILGATLDPSGVQKVIALLAANFSATGFEVHGPQDRSALPMRSPGAVGSPTVSQGLHVSQRW
jgi:dolichol-phosphate hexosyltransferase